VKGGIGQAAAAMPSFYVSAKGRHQAVPARLAARKRPKRPRRWANRCGQGGGSGWTEGSVLSPERGRDKSA